MWIPLALLGCDGIFGRDSVDSGAIGLVCGAWLVDSSPAAGSEDVWWTQPVVFTLSLSIAEATVHTNFGGGTTTVANGVVTFVPEAPFPPASTVVATLTGCGGSLGFSFSTAASGLPVDAAALPGHTWQLTRDSDGELDALRILDRMYGLSWPMVGVEGSAESPELTFFAAAGETCDGWTGELDATWVTDSFVAVGSDVLVVLLGDAAIPLHLDYFFLGFSVDGDALEGSHLIGTVDARDVAAIPELGVSQDEVCDLFGSFGVSCGACADDQPTCAPFAVDDLVSEDADPTTIQDATAACGP